MSFNVKTVTGITGLSRNQIGQWEKLRLVKPSIETSGRRSMRLYSFTDVALLKTAKMLMDTGLPGLKAKSIVRHLGKHFPDIQKQVRGMLFITDGESSFILTKDVKVMLDMLAKGHTVVALPLGKIIEDLKCDVDDVCREQRNAVVVRKKVYDVVLYPDTESGGYCVACPSLPGCDSQGDTEDEALEMIKDAIKGHLVVAARRKTKRAVRR